MKTAPVTRDGKGVFYWVDTGPVEYTAKAGHIIEARTVEALTMRLPSRDLAASPCLWVAE